MRDARHSKSLQNFSSNNFLYCMSIMNIFNEVLVNKSESVVTVRVDTQVCKKVRAPFIIATRPRVLFNGQLLPCWARLE